MAKIAPDHTCFDKIWCKTHLFIQDLVRLQLSPWETMRDMSFGPSWLMDFYISQFRI